MDNTELPRLYPASELKWSGVLKSVPKAADSFQPLYEAFTNGLEAIELRRKKGEMFSPYIFVDFFFNVDIEGVITGLSKIEVTDNGIGFDDENFKRLQIYKDDSKGFSNRGSGRIQLIHSFVKAKYESTYKQDGALRKRTFVLSKREEFLNNNAILQLLSEEECSPNSEIKTKVLLDELRENVDMKFYKGKSIEEVKAALIDHYMMQFCAYDTNLPSITITFFKGTDIDRQEHISSNDIPRQTGDDQFIEVPLCKISNDMKRIEVTNDKVGITIKPFKLQSALIKKNAVKITCKKELVDSVKVKMDCLPPDLEVNSHRYLFLLSSDYFDDNMGDTRDSFEVLNKTEFKKKAKQFGTITPQIILDDIEAIVSQKASEMYSEIAQQKEIHEQQLQELKDTYMLSEEALIDANINDSVEDILAKAYQYDAKLIAKQDAAYREKLLQLEALDTTSDNYQEDLENLVKDMSGTIPLQCKEALSRYVTRRALVIELLDKLIHKNTDVQRSAVRSMDEKLIHNLIFNQHSDDSTNSDMWLLNEDYLHYKGFSEHKLSEIEIGGHKLFRDVIDEEEQRYLNSLGEQRLKKRPDILLFPSEHKCVIIELKSLDANISDYLGQINKYATFVRSYTNDEFRIDTFYGYLVGEALEPNDVRAADNDFKYDSKFNYCYRPIKSIACLGDSSGSQDGTIYTEAISFSELLKRARKRNESFKAKLFSSVAQVEGEDARTDD